jgi:hypothetical protein
MGWYACNTHGTAQQASPYPPQPRIKAFYPFLTFASLRLGVRSFLASLRDVPSSPSRLSPSRVLELSALHELLINPSPSFLQPI